MINKSSDDRNGQNLIDFIDILYNFHLISSIKMQHTHTHTMSYRLCIKYKKNGGEEKQNPDPNGLGDHFFFSFDGFLIFFSHDDLFDN